MMAKVVMDDRARQELGFVPKDCAHLVRSYVEHNKITLSANDQIMRKRSVSYADAVIQPHDAEAEDCSPDVLLAYRLGNATSENLEDFKLALRLVRDRLKLPYGDTSIADAVRAWAVDARKEAKIKMFLEVAYRQGRATGPDGQAMWNAMEAACFDVTETRAGFAIDVIRKFMWQVKRKAAGLSVTNHLMPVLTGPQGKGKSTFVHNLCAPLSETKRDVDFQMICDDRIIDMWSSHILFIDEMSHFTKGDADKIKNVITAPTLTRRPMRSNETVQIKQEATFIGCTNKSLAQLIRDDTGGRRFAELVWRTDPDWAAMNAVDWKMLWSSVDENGPDPIGASTQALLKDQQEANRNQSPVEVWGRSINVFKAWTNVADMHETYREWERDAFPRHDTNQTMFGRTLTNLICTMDDFPWEKKRTGTGIQYRKA
jgi:hypothetical protein